MYNYILEIIFFVFLGSLCFMAILAFRIFPIFIFLF